LLVVIKTSNLCDVYMKHISAAYLLRDIVDTFLISIYLRRSNHISFEPGHYRQTIARPAIGNTSYY
jgi:hypothetical protein